MNNTNIIRLITACAVCALLCPKALAETKGGTVAVVNGEPVLTSEYDKNLKVTIENYKKALPAFFQQKDAMPQLEKAILDQMVDETLMNQQAVKQNIKVRDREIENGVAEVKKRFSIDPATGKPVDEKTAAAQFSAELKKEGLGVDKFKERIKRQLAIRKLVDEEVRSKVKPPQEQEIKNIFDIMTAANKSGAVGQAQLEQKINSLVGERIKASKILIKFSATSKKTKLLSKEQALAKAQDIKKRLDGGADFGAIAKKESQDAATYSLGGDMGVVSKGQLPSEIEEKVFAMKAGQTSDPLEGKNGYYIIKVTEKISAQNEMSQDVKELAVMAQRLKDASADRVHVRHILVKTTASMKPDEKAKAFAKAKSIKNRIDGGEDFSEIAKKESEDVESASRGGDLGPIIKGDLPPALENRAFSMKLREVSEPIETIFGWHIIRVDGIIAGQPVEYEAVKNDLGNYLMNKEAQKTLSAFVKGLKDKASIIITKKITIESKETASAKEAVPAKP
ncbi:MAG: peptidylprolyl isomerase [Elusimicrobia bacterium]|nr:peptidylprolyl isomerase [Elusimicrobiota bacterium]